MAQIAERRERTGVRSSFSDIAFTYTLRQATELLPEAWLPNSSTWSFDVDMSSRLERQRPRSGSSFSQARLLLGACRACKYAKFEARWGSPRVFRAHTTWVALLRRSGRAGERATRPSRALCQRRGSRHHLRQSLVAPRQSILKESVPSWLPLGGA